MEESVGSMVQVDFVTLRLIIESHADGPLNAKKPKKSKRSRNASSTKGEASDVSADESHAQDVDPNEALAKK